MSDLPTTADVLREIKSAGIIVGSWPRLKNEAKDLDLVVKAPPFGERNQTMQRLLKKFPKACGSSFMGHLFVYAVPMNVELFESKGTLPPDDPDKHEGVMTYYQARLRSVWMDVYGVTMRGVWQ